jgi:acetyl esterase/lipase
MSLYAPDIQSPDFSPFNDLTPHVGMPPTHIMVCGGDPLRDDRLIYKRALRENGVKTRLNIYPGMLHGYGAFPGLEFARKAFRDEMKGVGWLLGKEKTDEDVERIAPGCDLSFA